MKTVLITGASRGIGLAIARALSDADSQFDNIVLVARDTPQLAAAREELSKIAGNKAVHSIISDLGQPGFHVELFDELERLGVTVTTIVNNAGYTAPCSFNDITDEDLDLTLQINVKAPLLIIREARRRGHKLDFIINIASTAGMNGRPKWTTYSASKAALLVASEAMMEEFRSEGVEVLRISPGRCATDLRRTLAPEEDPSTIVQPAAVAEGLKWLISEPGKVMRQQNLVLR